MGLMVKGVLDRETNKVHLFERGDRTKRAKALDTMDVDDPELPALIGKQLYAQLLEDIEVNKILEPIIIEVLIADIFIILNFI